MLIFCILNCSSSLGLAGYFPLIGRRDALRLDARRLVAQVGRSLVDCHPIGSIGDLAKPQVEVCS